MSTSVTRNVYFRPTLSPSLPKTNAPKGRTTNPAAKVASVERKAAVGFVFGKNCSDKIVARLPKIKKSYHSISVPTEEAVITDQNFFYQWGKRLVSLWLQFKVRKPKVGKYYVHGLPDFQTF
jgi:hypothetical protein